MKLNLFTSIQAPENKTLSCVFTTTTGEIQPLTLGTVLMTRSAQLGDKGTAATSAAM